jgi:hypothetical protein
MRSKEREKNMNKCYCCGRNENEAKNHLIGILEEERTRTLEPIRQAMEQQRQFAKDMEDKWKSVSPLLPKELIGAFNLSLQTIQKEIANVNIPGFEDVLKVARHILGPSLDSLKLSDLGDEIEAKLKEISLNSDLGQRIAILENEFAERKTKIENHKSIMLKHQIKEPSLVPVGQIHVDYCIVCHGIVMAMIPGMY